MVGAKNTLIIGGGAAGFFAAIELAARDPQRRIRIVEKTNKLLSKVAISGGGRCNVTHHCFDTGELVKNYPRGAKELRQVFARFGVQDTIAWFGQHGVSLKTEADGRMFPRSDSSQTIVDCFLTLARQRGVEIVVNCAVEAIQYKAPGFEVRTAKGLMEADTVICASGGHHKAEAYTYLRQLGHQIVDPIPSLFTLNLPGEPIRKELQGLSVPNGRVSIAGTALAYRGPLLITHWGLSGPAVLKLSAFAAKELFAKGYRADIVVNWAGTERLEEVVQALKQLREEKAKALPQSHPGLGLPRRLWDYLCRRAGIDGTRTWAETGNTALVLLANSIFATRFGMTGKTTYKEEFVTSGGVALKEVDFKTMQSKLVPGLFFCGEVLDIDGITGGFNFQNAWSTAWICASNA